MAQTSHTGPLENPAAICELIVKHNDDEHLRHKLFCMVQMASRAALY